MIWLSLGVLAVAVAWLWGRLNAVTRDLAEARAVLLSLPEVHGRLAEVAAKRATDREETDRDELERAQLRR